MKKGLLKKAAAAALTLGLMFAAAAIPGLAERLGITASAYELTSEGFMYEYLDLYEEYRIVGYAGASDTAAIPGKINGSTNIAVDYDFAYNSGNLKTVYVPTSVFVSTYDDTLGYSYNSTTGEYTKISGFTIRAAKGSYAYRYAVEKDISFEEQYDLSDFNVSLDADVWAEFDYTGYYIKPNVIVTREYYDYASGNYETITLEKGTDYSLSYKNNKYPGTATVTVTGQNGVTGTVDLTFTIRPTSIYNTEITLDDTYPYKGGNPVNPKPVIKYKGQTLVEGTDYTLSYEDDGDIGSAYVEITGINGFTDTCSTYYYIDTAPLSGASVTLAQTSYTYSGSSFTPGTTVRLNGVILKRGTDYTVSYSNNINAGTAKVSITGDGYYYSGTITKTFKINPKTPTTVTVAAISPQSYTGSAVTPKPKVYADGKLLTNGTDYTLTYTNNKNIGTASCKVTLKGNYTAVTRTVKFSIKFGIVNNLKVSKTAAKSVSLKWDKAPLAQGYQIFRYDPAKKTWVKVKVIRSGATTTYTSGTLTSAKEYQYAVKAFRKLSNGSYQFGTKSTVTCYTRPMTPSITIKSYSKKAIIKWSTNSRTEGYEIYWCGGCSAPCTDEYSSDCYNWEYKKMKTTTGNKVSSYTKPYLSSSTNYHFKIRAYKTFNGKKVYSAWSDVKNTRCALARLNTATLKSRSTYKEVNVQETTSYTTTHTLTAEEKKILANFASKHFKKGWSAAQKVVYTSEWIRNNLTYGNIPTASHTKNIFVYKEGQCTDYNGAMIEMMTYLGYDARVIRGWRTSGSPHSWGEITIDGQVYLIEVGETRYDSPGWGYKWKFLCQMYSEKQENSGYIKLGKVY